MESTDEYEEFDEVLSDPGDEGPFQPIDLPDKYKGEDGCFCKIPREKMMGAYESGHALYRFPPTEKWVDRSGAIFSSLPTKQKGKRIFTDESQQRLQYRLLLNNLMGQTLTGVHHSRFLVNPNLAGKEQKRAVRAAIGVVQFHFNYCKPSFTLIKAEIHKMVLISYFSQMILTRPRI
jgi:hypothetical protein